VHSRRVMVPACVNYATNQFLLLVNIIGQCNVAR
jgi:hypothetical protein